MKKLALLLSLCMILSLLNPLYAFADTNSAKYDVTSAVLTDIVLEADEDTAFNKDVASDDAFINLVVTAAQKKEKDISLEGVHPQKNIKLYGVSASDNILKSFCENYSKEKAFKKSISQDYAVLTLYFNKDGEYVDSLVFTKKENLPDSADKNGWVMLSSGSFVLSDDLIKKFFDKDNLKDYINDIGLQNADEIKLLSSIPYMPVSVFFVQNNEEFIIPLKDTANMKTSQIYKTNDIFDKFLTPILDYQNKKAEENLNIAPEDRLSGGSPLPDEFPTISPINLNSYFAADDTVASTSKENTEFPTAAVIGTAIVMLIVAGVAVICIKRKKSDNQ